MASKVRKNKLSKETIVASKNLKRALEADMAKVLKLRQGPTGDYIVKDRQDAQHLFEHLAKTADEITKIKKTVKLDQLEEDRRKASRALADWLVANKRKSIRNPKFIGEVVERTKRIWVWDKEDVPEGLEDQVKTLRRILSLKFRNVQKRKEIINLVTKRVIDPEGLQEAINDGLLSYKDVAPALITTVETRYVTPKPNNKAKVKKMAEVE